jgi:hypothetical protein
VNLQQYLEEQMKEDFNLLKEYEEKLRCSKDPREKRSYSNEVQELKQRIFEREAEIQSLKKVGLSPQTLIENYLQNDSSELEPADVRKIEQALQSNTLNASMLAQGCRLLRKEKGLDLVINQLNWISELAGIADGVKPRYFLPAPKPTGRLASTDWIKALLKQGLPGDYSCSIALTLGSFGIFIPEMVPPLQFLFRHPKHGSDNRDAALIYLCLIGSSEVVSMLIQAADTPESEDDYLYQRGVLGLLLIDNVNVLAEQLRKALPHSDLNAYAFGLAGSRDPQGRVLLERIRNNSSARVRAAITNALNQSWVSTPRNTNSVNVASSPQAPQKTFFGQFTQKAILVIMLAQEESRRLKHNFVGSEQILLGLIGESTGIAAAILKLNKVNLKDARIEVEKMIGRGSDNVSVEIPFTPGAKRLMELAKIESEQLRHSYVGTEHLLLGLIREGNGVGVQVLKKLGVNLQALRKEVLRAISS